MKILKFGGTSMGSQESLQNVCNIISKNNKQKVFQIIVCSAMSGVTNKLLEIGELALNGDLNSAKKIVKEIKSQHFKTAESFQVAKTFKYDIETVLEELHNLINGINLIKELSPRVKAQLLAFGEKLSTRLLTEILKTQNIVAIQKDSNFIRTTGDDFWEDNINWETTKKEAKKIIPPLLKNGQIPIITGFFGKNPEGEIALLGRGGSDFSASILAVSLHSKTVEIWTDVDGFMSADPRIINSAKVLDEIGFKEASELCFFGAKVLHPRTIRPVMDIEGDVWIKNTFNINHQGTKIVKHAAASPHAVLSISSKKIGLLSFDFFGAPLQKKKSQIFLELFMILNQYNVSVDAISASEAMLSFCIEENFLKNQALLDKLKKIAPLEIRKNRSILCIVSPENIQGTHGTLAKIFDAIGDAKVSVEMDSENASEVVQLIVVKNEDVEKTLKVLHKKLVE